MTGNAVKILLIAAMVAASIIVLPAQTSVVIAVVKSPDVPQYDLAVDGFAEVLAEKKIPIHLKTFDPGDRETVGKIESLAPAMILTVGTAATRLIAEKIEHIPIVFSMIMHPLKSGITSRDIVGASLDIPVIVQLENLKAVVPRIETVGVIYNPTESVAVIVEARQSAAQLQLTLNDYPVRSQKEIPEITDLKIDALWMIPDTVVCRGAIVRQILLSSIKKRVPVMGISPSYARAGALLALSCDYKDIGRQSGETAFKILSGENYCDLKITVPRKIKLYLNKTVADRLGIVIPEDVMKKASEVYGK